MEGAERPPQRSFNLIQTGRGGARLFPSYYYSPPNLQTFLRSCSTLLLLGDRSKFAVKTRYPINYPLLLGFKMFPGYFSKIGDEMRINQQMKILSKNVILFKGKNCCYLNCLNKRLALSNKNISMCG